jgi:hypothetical protein
VIQRQVDFSMTATDSHWSASGSSPPDLAYRFWSKVGDPDPATGCTEWLASLRNGYGQMGVSSKRTEYAHRIAWELQVGPIPDGLWIDHKCRNRACVNVEHLRLVTPRQNALENNSCPTAINAAKTRCDHGHPFDDANTRHLAGGGRNCRACDSDFQRNSPTARAYNRDRAAKRRAALKAAAA